MSGRPEILFPLFGAITKLDGIGPKTAQVLEGTGIATPRDLLFTLPASGIDRARRNSIADIVPPTTATVEVTVGAHQPPRTMRKSIEPMSSMVIV